METIKSNDEISEIFSSGRRYSNQFASFIVKEAKNISSKESTGNEHDLNGRVAFIAGKKHGNAVWRNSAKRRLREIYRANSGSLGNFDVLFIARSPIMDASYSKVLSTCEQTLKRFSND